MYESIRIQNFRGLKDLTIENLGRVNLLVGANNVDKTSVLEALALLHMHQDGYELGLMLESRGYRKNESLDGALSTFFYGGALAFCIEGLRVDGDKVELNGERHLRNSGETVNGIAHARVGLNNREHLQFYYLRHPASGLKSGAFLQQHEVPVPLDEARPYPRSYHLNPLGQVSLLTANSRLTTPGLAELLTERERTSRPGSIVEQMKVFDARLVDLFVGFDLTDREPTVNAKLDDGVQTVVIPLRAMGGGSRRLFELALTIPLAQDGLSLVDEIDMGVYYENLPNLWELVFEMCLSHNVQLVATTHSNECVQAALRAFDGEHAGDFRLHRLSRREDEIIVTTYEHETAEAALELQLEVR